MPLAQISPAVALKEWLQCIRSVSTETVSLSEASGRVLAETITSDRDHPPCDMSAMDGYAVRYAEVPNGVWTISDTPARIGHPPVRCESGQAVYIVTGAPVPHGADTVIRVEDVSTEGQTLRLQPAARVTRGGNIRCRGENVAAGSPVIEPGGLVTEAVVSTAATFGASELKVFCKVRVGLIITGDELLGLGDKPQSYQIRDGSGPAIHAALNHLPWITCEQWQRVEDEPTKLRHTLEQTLKRCDAVILTGGVSMGERDYVPRTVENIGGRLCFHRLPIRPGKPILGAITPEGKPVVGLPGNPVSTLVTLKRFALPGLRQRAGFKVADLPVPCVQTNGDLPSDTMLWHYKPVCLQADGQVWIDRWVSSGDITSAARSDGFIEIPPAPRTETRFFKFYAW